MIVYFSRVETNVHLFIDDGGRLRANKIYVDLSVNLEDETQLEKLRETVKETLKIQPSSNIIFFQNYSKGEYNTDKEEIKTSKITYKSDNGITYLPGNGYEDCFFGYFKRMFLMNKDDDLKASIVSCRVFTGLPDPNIISFVHAPTINHQPEWDANNSFLNALSMYIKIGKRKDDFDPNCDTCREATKQFAEAVMALNHCIFFNSKGEKLNHSTEDDMCFIDVGYERLTLNRANCTRYEFHANPDILVLGKQIVKEFQVILQTAKIQSLFFFDDMGMGVVVDVPEFSENDFVF